MTAFGFVTVLIAGLALGLNAAFWMLARHRIRSWSKLARTRSEPPRWPKVHVFVCLKGNLPRIRETVRALDEQDYPGDYRVTFLTEAGPTHDTAARQLGPCLESTSRSDHCVAGRVLSSAARCAQKNFNLVAGIRHAERTHEPIDVYAFCDGDLLVRKRWLREMVRPIAHRDSEASTSFHYAASEERRILGALHGMAETMQSLAVAALRGSAWGGSMAFRASVFRKLRLEDVWSRTVVDDVTLSRALRESRIRVTPVAQFLVSSSSEIGSYRGFVRWLGRQLFFVKIYLPTAYRFLSLMAGSTLLTVWLAVFHASYRLLQGEWAAGALAGWGIVATAAAILGGLHSFRHLIPDRPPIRFWIGATLLVPGTSLLACADASFRRRRLTWRDLTYFLEGDGNVSHVTVSGTSSEEAVPGEAVA